MQSLYLIVNRNVLSGPIYPKPDVATRGNDGLAFLQVRSKCDPTDVWCLRYLCEPRYTERGRYT